MSEQIRCGFCLDEYLYIYCDMPGCTNYQRVLVGRHDPEKITKPDRELWKREPGWVTVKFPVDEYTLGHKDYCPECAKILGIGEWHGKTWQTKEDPQ